LSQRQITLRDIWQILWKRKFWLVLPIILVTVVAFGGSYLLPTIYESATKVVISNQKFISPALERMLPDEAGVLPEPRARQYWLAATRSEITSSGYINDMIEDLKLALPAEVEQAAAKMREKFPENDFAVMSRSLQIEDLKKYISVDLIGENQVVITCRSENPQSSARMATALAEIYRERKLAGQVLAGDEGQSLTDEQLAIAKKEFEDIEKQLSDFKTTYLNRQLQTGISSDANLSTVESEVDATRLEMREASDRVKFLKTRLADAGIDLSAAVTNSRELTRHKNSALAATTQIADFMPRYLWKDGKIQSLLIKTSDALDSLRMLSNSTAKQMNQGAAVSAQGDLGEYIYLMHQLEFLSGKERVLAEAISEIKGLIAGQPYYDQMVKRLEDKLAEKRKTYQTWQDEADKLKIRRAPTDAEDETKYTILEPAAIPLEPASPNRVKIALMGLALGIVLGGCAVVIAEVVDHSIKRIEDIEELLGLEVVGTIPNIMQASQPKGAKVA